MYKFYAFILILVLLTGCGVKRKAEPTAVISIQTQRPTIAVSSTPVPTATLSPSATPTSVPPTATTFILPTSVPTLTPVVDPPTATPQTVPNGQVVEGGDGLRLRAAPSTSGQVLANLDELTPLIASGRTADNGWLQITAENGSSGWVMAQYVQLYVDINSLPVAGNTEVAAAAVAPVNGDGLVVAEGNGVRLRTQPSTNAQILGFLAEQSAVYIVGRTDDSSWLQVITPSDQIGWVWAAYIQTSKNIAALEVPPEAYDPTPAAFEPPSVTSASGTISNVTSTSTQIFLRGQSMGNNARAFSRVGDSISATGHFLYQFGWGTYSLHEYSYYQAVINHFVSTSFSNESLAARSGWTTSTLLDPSQASGGVCQPGEMPLVCEYRVVKPSIALIMIGTNDIGRNSAAQYQANLERIVQITIDMGVIPVLSTIPPKVGAESEVNKFNQIIISVAYAYDIPLWDFYTATSALPNRGLDPDGVHPSFVGSEYSNYTPSADFTPQNLQYGFPLRNLMALQVLDLILRQVIWPNQQSAGPVTGSNTDGLNTSPPVTVGGEQPPASTSTCPGAPPTRLSIGQTGRVTPGAANNFRSQPSMSAELLGKIPAGASFAVLEGPVCSDGLAYWKVDYNGQVGWTAEGRGSEYWVEPVTK